MDFYVRDMGEKFNWSDVLETLVIDEPEPDTRRTGEPQGRR